MIVPVARLFLSLATNWSTWDKGFDVGDGATIDFLLIVINDISTINDVSNSSNSTSNNDLMMMVPQTVLSPVVLLVLILLV